MKKLYTSLFIVTLLCLSIVLFFHVPATPGKAATSNLQKASAGGKGATVPGSSGYFIKAASDTVIFPNDPSAIKNKKEITDDVTVTQLPSYSSNAFILLIQSHSNKPIDMQVYNINGCVMETWSNLPANRSIQIGDHYIAGIYLAEVTQGSRKVVAKLLKINK